MRRIASGFANEQIKPHLCSGSERIKYIKDLCENNKQTNNKFLKDKINKLENWEKRANQFLPLALKLIGEKND